MKQKLFLTPFEHSDLTDSLQIWATVQREKTCFTLSYTIEGLVSQIQLPQFQLVPKRQSQLWEHTCFEAFISSKNEASYWELNLSSSQSWNFYRLSSYRENLQEVRNLETIQFIKNEITQNRYHLEAQLDLAPLFVAQAAPSTFHLGITAVIEEVDHSYSYWAIKHCGEKPDFHLKKSFVLEI